MRAGKTPRTTTGRTGARRRALALGLTVALLGGIAASVGGPSTLVPRAAAAAPAPLGTNLGQVNYYDGLVPFANLVDQASDWIPQITGGPWGSGPALTLRRDGWPASFTTGQYATAVLAEVRYPAGTYSVAWQGKGTFAVNGQTFGSATVAGGTGSVALDGTSIVLLDLRTTVASDPLRAISVRVPGAAPADVFRAAYLAQLAPYRAVRFMDWQRTNSTFADPARTFTCDNRTLPDSYSQGTRLGVSIERMVQLANTLGADPWFTIPHEASDAWITCHAQVVAANLAPGLTPRYEFSNETWNPQFTAFHDLRQEGIDLGLGAGDTYLGLQQRHGQRHTAAMALVSAVFTTVNRPVIRVLAGQAANAWVLSERLKTTGAANATDEIAIAPYLHVHGLDAFDPTDAAVIASWTQAQLFANLTTAQTAEVDGWTTDHVTLAGQWAKTLVAYEGGQHLAGDTGNTALTTLFTGANRAAAMGTAYRTYLDHWRTVTGGTLLMHFSDVGPYTQWGSWGALETPEQTTSPKYAALTEYATGTTTTTSSSSSTTTTTVAPPTTSLRFTALNPARVLDSRAASAVGDFTTPWGAGTVRDVQVAGRGGVPVGASAVVLNLTAVAPTAASAISVWPTGQVRPGPSALRLTAGLTLANAFTVPLGLGGKVRVANDAGSVDLLADVAGYFTASGAGYTALTPKRIIDSRPATRVGGFSSPWTAGTARGITIGGKNGVPTDATAVTLTVSAVNPTAASFLEVWPNGLTRPTALSSLNFPAGRATANQVTVKLGTNGAVQVFNLLGTTDVTIDVTGYYRAGSGATFTPVPMARVLDSRSATTVGGFTTPWGAGITRTVSFSGRGGIPAGALAVTGNLVTLNPTAASTLLAWSAGATRPTATTTAFPAASVNAGAFTAKLSTAGAASVRNAAGSTDVLGDVTGYYR